MDETNRCHAEYSIQKWCQLLGLKQKKLVSFLELTENQLKTKVLYSENIIRIEIPNLLKKRDNYTKNLQVNDKQLASKEVEVEVEVEKNKNKDKKVWILPEGINKKAWQEFEEHRSNMPKDKKLTDIARIKAANKLLKLSKDYEQQQAIVDQSIERGYTGLFPTEQKQQMGRATQVVL
jgi:hypothetical protein